MIAEPIAVIGDEDDDCVILQSSLLQRDHDAPDLVVNQ